MEQAEGVISRILKQIRPEVDFYSSDDFIHAGLLDSYDLVTLVSALESEFDILIDGGDVVPENFDNFSSIIKLIEKYRKDGQ
jgi:acyl carrier protein